MVAVAGGMVVVVLVLRKDHNLRPLGKELLLSPIDLFGRMGSGDHLRI